MALLTTDVPRLTSVVSTSYAASTYYRHVTFISNFNKPTDFNQPAYKINSYIVGVTIINLNLTSRYDTYSVSTSSQYQYWY